MKCARFAHEADLFISKMEQYILGTDPTSNARAKAASARILARWKAPIVSIVGKLERIDSTIEDARDLSAFIASVDVSRVTERAGTSETGRSVLIQAQKLALESASKVESELASASNHLLRTSAIDVSAVSALLRERVREYIAQRARAGAREFGPVYSKLARRYVPLMAESEREAMIALFTGDVARAILRTARIAIDEKRPLYAQMLTSGDLMPLTRAMGRDALFAVFGHSYNLRESFEANLAYLANKTGYRVIFSSKIIAHAIEYDSRAIFDEAYVLKNNLAIAPLAGLSERMMKRYTTLRTLGLSRAQVPAYFVRNPRETTHSIIIEALTGNLFRIMGAAFAAQANAAQANAAQANAAPADAQSSSVAWALAHYVTNNRACDFLVIGESTRADEYNARIEKLILERPRASEINAINAINRARIATDARALESGMRANMQARIIEYSRECARSRASDARPLFVDKNATCDKIFLMAINELAESFRVRAREDRVSAYYAQLDRIANRITGAIFDRAPEFEDAENVPRVVGKIMDNLELGGVFAICESLGTIYRATQVNKPTRSRI